MSRDESGVHSRRFGDSSVVVGTVVVSTFFIGFGGGVIFPIIPNLGAVLGISPFLVGVILSANRFTRLLANAPAGSLVDRVGTRTPFVAGMAIQTVGTAAYVVAFLLPFPTAWFLGARILWGVGSAFVFATAFTIAADISTGGSRGTNMGMIRGGVLFGFPTGVVLGGLISELYGNVAAFSLAAGFAAVATLIAYASIPETHVEGNVRRSVKPWNVDTSLPALTVGTVNFAVFFVYLGALFATLVVFIREYDLGVFGLGPQGSSGIFMALTVVAAGVFTFVGGAVSDRRTSRVPTLLVFLLLAGGGFVLLALSDSVSDLVVACAFIGAGQGGTSGPLMALLADMTPDERVGRAIGTNNVLGDIGGGLGPISTLPVIDAIGFVPVYLACAILPFAAAGVLLGGVFRETGRFLPGRAYSPSESERD